MTVLGKVITIPWMVVSFILLGVTIKGIVCDHTLRAVGDPPYDGGKSSSGWWVTKFWMVGDPPLDGG